MVLYKKVDGVKIELSSEEEAEVRSEWAEKDAEAEATAWFGNRVNEYPSISDQLDMLWHSMDKGEIPGKGIPWYNAIKVVKETYPKPSEK